MSVAAPPQSPPREDVEALIEEAWQHARRRQRRRLVAVLAGVGLAALVVLLCTAVSDGGATRHRSARRAAGAAGVRGLPRYRYTRAVIAPSPGTGLPGRSVTVENWVGTDGSWRLRETVLGGAPGSLDVVIAGDGLLPPQANASGSFEGAPFNARNPGDGLFTTSQIASLPTDPSALASRLQQR